ncbi:hypothetical protein TRVA0_025S00342 [Trichomonascus vanleenenianus]|uniref:Rxt2p n=1 Tax=Trichomonascus vanleenenianus TaxID=2268995 RepID=UPI003ECA9417
MDEETLNQIARFKEAVERPEDASDSEEESIGPAFSNRGHKLKRDAREVYEGRMVPTAEDGYGVKVVQYAGQKRAVIYKKRKVSHAKAKELALVSGEDAAVFEEEIEDAEDELNPYGSIKLEDLLAPVSHPSEVPTHAGVSRTFTTNTISKLAMTALDIICEEQKHVVQFSKLMAAFLGDDPRYVLPRKLDLPEYDHLNEDNEVAKRQSETNGTKTNDNKTPDGEVKGEGEETNGAERRITRNQTNQEVDPFFAMPRVKIDRDFGISREAAEETRQLTQIAQQRSEEFIRCMTNVRMGLLRADRFRSMVYGWCKEMSGDGEGMSEAGDNAESDFSDSDFEA